MAVSSRTRVFASSDRTCKFLGCSLVAALTLVTRPGTAAPADASGEGSAAPASSTDSGALSEVVVTASKLHAAAAIDTPASIQAISGAALQNQGASGIMSIAGQVPGLSVQNQGPGNRKYVIRGLNSTGDPTIGVYYGEAVITEGNASDQLAGGLQPDVRLYDLNRVEVLRGPQGTLYGASSMSGTIRFMPNEPDMDKVDGYVTLESSRTRHTGTNNYNANGALNLPLVDNVLALRLVGWKLYDSGYVDQIAVGVGTTGVSKGVTLPVPALGLLRDANDDSVGGGRAILRYQPMENLTIDADYTAQSESVGGPSSYTPAGQTQIYGGSVPPIQGCDLCSTDTIREQTTDALKVFGGTVRWRTPFGELTATDHQFNRHTVFPHNSGLFAVGVNIPAVSIEPREFEANSSELRFASSFNSPVNFVAGIFRNQTVYTFSNNVITANGLGLASGPFSTDNTADALLYPGLGTTLFGRLDHRVNTEWATFGEATWKINDQWTAVGGVRYYSEGLTGYQEQTHPFGGFKVTSPTGVPIFDVPSKFNKVTWKGSLSYELSRALLAYGTVATGFRSGGLNVQSQPFEPIPGSFEPDTLISYELGLKGRLFDDRFEYQVDGFFERWGNMQVQETTADGAFSFQGNAGTAHIKGAEMELRARPTEHFTASVTGSYQHAVLAQGATVFQKKKNPTLGIMDDRIPNVPSVQASVSLEYSQPLTASGNWVGTLRSDLTYRGALNSAFNSDPFNVPVESYTLFNLRAGLIRGDWTLNLFVNNVTDKRAQLTAGKTASLPLTFLTVQPRTVGLSITRNF